MYARKAQSEIRLVFEGIPVNTFLPPIENAFSAKVRNSDAIVHRSMALLAVSMKAEGASKTELQQLIKQHGLHTHFTPAETLFLAKENPEEHELLQFSWQREAVCTLLWAIGFMDSLTPPTHQCSSDMITSIVSRHTSQSLIKHAQVRSTNQLLDQVDLIYRYHWAIRDAFLQGLPRPSSLHPDVIMARHHALNWLIGVGDGDWDNVSTDT